MNLADFQAHWLDILLALQKDPSAPLPANTYGEVFEDLSLPKAKAIAQMVEQGKVSVLCGVLPDTLKGLLPAVLQQTLAQTYARAFPESTVIPAAQGIPAWFRWLLAQSEVQKIPFATTLLAYELATLKLCFYQLPRVPELPHARLAPWAGLWVGTPHLEEILSAFKHQSTLPSITEQETPQQGWLLYRRHGTEIKQVAIHWGLFEVLSLLDGTHSWVYYLEQVCKAFPELQSQRKTLEHWLIWIEKEQLLSYY